MPKTKKWFTLDDLYDFYLGMGKTSKFSARETGYALSVQVPTTFEVTESQYEDNTLLMCKVKLMHSGENRNKSNVTDDALVKASKGLAYKPILANFVEYVNDEGETELDFTSHDMEIDENGNIKYLEKQIGCFTSDEPTFEVEESTGHNFLYGYCAIPRDYTEAASIIERKNGTKVSVELLVNEMSYNAKSKVLDLTDVCIMGATCLGKDRNTLENVEEGMLNARLDIADFSRDNNSMMKNFDTDAKLVETLEKLNETLKGLSINNAEGKEDNVLENNLTEPTTVVLDENGTPALEDNAVVVNSEGEGTVVDDTTGEGAAEGTTEPVVVENIEEPVVEPEEETFTKSFELSHSDIRSALYALLEPLEELNNEWYYIETVYDDRFIYSSWNGGYFGCKYTKDETNVSLDGEPYKVFAEFLTESEMASLTEMRANYSQIVEELTKYQKAEMLEDKKSVFADYSEYLENEEFVALMSEENLMKYSKDELTEKADAIVGRMSRKAAPIQNTVSFASTTSKTDVDFLDKLLRRK